MSVFYLLFCVVASACGQGLKVDVYYEALCPDSVRFITDQLFPTYAYTQMYLDLRLIPFGFATADNSTGHWIFKCQHGPLECLNNKIHSAVIANNSIYDSIDFINCAMKTKQNSNQLLEKCANDANISWEIIEDYLSSGKADELLAENGRKTSEVQPKITYIPTIIFNGIYDEKLEDEAQKFFLGVICRLLKNKPNICNYLNIIYNIIM